MTDGQTYKQTDLSYARHYTGVRRKCRSEASKNIYTRKQNADEVVYYRWFRIHKQQILLHRCSDMMPVVQYRWRTILCDVNVILTRRSADADKPARRVWRSVKVTKHSTIPYVRFSYCAIVTLSLRRAVFTIFDFKKCRDLEMGSKVTHSHWEWCHSIDCVWFPISVL